MLFWSLLALIYVISFPIYAQFAGGSGTPQDPWQVETAGQLNQVRNYLESCFIQTADIYLGVAPFNEYEGWEPIGKPYRQPYSGPSFQGVYNGNGHSITGLYINRPEVDNQGLFGFSNGTIKNLGLEEIDVRGFENVGGLAGLNEGSIVDCHSKGIVTGEYYVGGLVGSNNYGTIIASWNAGNVLSNRMAGGLVAFNSNGSIQDCHNEGNVSCPSDAGGLVSSSTSLTISNCYNTGNVNCSGYGKTGGLVGYSYLDTITNCYNTGKVTASYSDTGGLLGQVRESTMQACYNTGDVTGADYTGGLAGRYYSLVTLSDCYNTGKVTGAGYTGGLVGQVDSSISNCYNTGNVTGATPTGGLAGSLYLRGTLNNCYNTGKVTGATSTGGLAGSISSNGTASFGNSYNTGEVSGVKWVGGLLGSISNGVTVSNCYSIGTTTGTENAGGLIGRNYLDGGEIIDSYWDIEKSGQTTSEGGEGRLTAQMVFPHGEDTYIGWDWEIWAPDVSHSFNGGYPCLRSFYEFAPDLVNVDLNSFSATIDAANNVELNWQSQNENLMLGYRVFRSVNPDPAAANPLTDELIPATNTSSTQSYSFTDNTVEMGVTYYYWLETVDYFGGNLNGSVSVTVFKEVPDFPDVTTLKNAYPNPFKLGEVTNIEVSIKEGETGTLTIFNAKGQVLKTVSLPQGSHSYRWNGRDNKGSAVGSGIYFYKLNTPSLTQSKKMVILK
jgi:hypothetical protein